MGLASCAQTVSMCWEPRRQRRPCGGWSISVSTPHICGQYVLPALRPERRRGLPKPRNLLVSPCISTSVDATLVIDHCDKQAECGTNREEIL